MSGGGSDDLDLTEDGSELIPTPRAFVIEVVEDGAYRKQLPTLTAVFVGCNTTPDPEELGRLDGASIDTDPKDPDRIQLNIFITPRQGDTSKFSDVFSYSVRCEAKTIKNFLSDVKKVKTFVFAVSCDDFYFKCKVDTDSSNVLESSCEYRLLH